LPKPAVKILIECDSAEPDQTIRVFLKESLRFRPERVRAGPISDSQKAGKSNLK
jgi:hypothetical protein